MLNQYFGGKQINNIKTLEVAFPIECYCTCI